MATNRGLSPKQRQVLNVMTNQRITATQIGELLRKPSKYVLEALNGLYAKGLVDRIHYVENHTYDWYRTYKESETT